MPSRSVFTVQAAHLLPLPALCRPAEQRLRGASVDGSWLGAGTKLGTVHARTVELRFQSRKRGVETKLAIGDETSPLIDATLIRSIAKAHEYYDAIKNGQTVEEIAKTENLSKRRIMQVIELAFLAPEIVKQIVQGDQPAGLTAKWLGINPLPSEWQAQRRIIAAL